MKRNYASILAVTLAAFSTGHALAADAGAGKTRDDVKAELAEAVRTGDLIGSYTGEKLNQLHPERYPAAVVGQARTRAQVKAELDEAVRTGELVGSYTGEKLNQLHPERYPAKQAAQGKTREQVKAELNEAVRNGTLPSLGGA